MIYTNWKDLDAPKIDLKEGKDSTTIGDALTVIKNSYSEFIKEISYEGYIDSTAILKTAIILNSGQGGKIIIKPHESFINYDGLKLFRENSSTGDLTSAYFERQNDGTFVIFPSGGGEGSVEVKFYFTHIGLANNILNRITYCDNGINLNHDPFYLQKQKGQLYNNVKKSTVEQSNWTQNEQLQWYKNQLMKNPQTLTLYGFQQHTYDGYQINSQPISLLIPYKNLTNEPFNKENGKPSQGFGTQNGGIYKYFNHYGGVFPDFVNNISNKGNSTYEIIFQDDKITIDNQDYYFNPHTDLLLCFAQTVGNWTCTKGVWEGEEGKENSIFIKQENDYSTQSNIDIQGQLSFRIPIVTVINSNININHHSLNIFSWNSLNKLALFELQTENNILLNPTILLNSSSNKIEKIRNFEWISNSHSATDKFGAFNTMKASASINSPKFSLSINFLNWIEDFFDLQHIISFENTENRSQCLVEGHQELQNYSIKYGFHFYNTVQTGYDGVFPQSINLIPSDLYWEAQEGESGAAYSWLNTFKWYSYTESKNVAIKNTTWSYHYNYYANFWYSSAGIPSDTTRNTYTDAITTFDTPTNYFYLKLVIYHNLLTYSNLEQVKGTKILIGNSSQGIRYKFMFTLNENQKAILNSEEYNYVGYFYSPDFNSVNTIDGTNWNSVNQTLSVMTNNSSENAELEYYFYYWKKNLEL